MTDYTHNEIGNIHAGNVSGSISNRVHVSLGGGVPTKEQLIKELLEALGREPLMNDPYAASLYKDVKTAEATGDTTALKKAAGFVKVLIEGVASNGAYDGLKQLAAKIQAFIGA